MSDNHKHLANTLIEIPKETIQQWNVEAQKFSMEYYNRVESAVVELYMKLKTETFRIIERNKYESAVQDQKIKMVEKQRDLYQKMLTESNEEIDDLKSQRENKEKDFREVVRENERLLRKIQNDNAPK